MAKLADLRREYSRPPLQAKALPATPLPLFLDWMREAQEAELLEPNAMTLATVDEAGQPFTRTVLAKQVDEKGIVFYTNFASRKAQQIATNARVSLLFPWLPLERQVSINGPATKISSAEALKYFLSRPKGSQLGAWASAQSEVISSRALLEGKLAELKRKFADGQVPLPSFWGGYRVKPESFEFWQGGPQRLHDRFLYTQQADGWCCDRLSP